MLKRKIPFHWIFFYYEGVTNGHRFILGLQKLDRLGVWPQLIFSKNFSLQKNKKYIKKIYEASLFSIFWLEIWIKKIKLVQHEHKKYLYLLM